VNRLEEALLESCVDASRGSIVYGSREVDPIRWARTTIGAADERGRPRNGRVANVGKTAFSVGRKNRKKSLNQRRPRRYDAGETRMKIGGEGRNMGIKEDVKPKGSDLGKFHLELSSFPSPCQYGHIT
jgi:hypothetical protein